MPKDPNQMDLEYVEVEPHLKVRVEQLIKEGMTKAAAKRFAEQEEDQMDAAHTPPIFQR